MIRCPVDVHVKTASSITMHVGQATGQPCSIRMVCCKNLATLLQVRGMLSHCAVRCV
jgi:hypothetical protein